MELSDWLSIIAITFTGLILFFNHLRPPNMGIRINSQSLGGMEINDGKTVKGMPYIYLEGSLFNTSKKQLIISHFQFYVRRRNKMIRTSAIELSLMLKSHNSPLDIPAEATEKQLTKMKGTITNGTPSIFYALFNIPADIHKDLIENKRRQMKIICTDVMGKRYEFEYYGDVPDSRDQLKPVELFYF